MTLSSSPTFLQPPAEAFTRSGEACDGVVASFDLLFLPGIVMCFVDDSTCTTSSGSEDAATALHVAAPGPALSQSSSSTGTTDSSVLGPDRGGGGAQPGGCANQFKFPFREPASIDLAALMMMLGGFVALIAETVEQGFSQPGAQLN